jgi:AcrR family transcriptional regulator
MSRTGRRPGPSETRGAILEAAREAFAAKGYERATLRSIAGAAGVDPAMVHHHFGTKAALLREAVRLPFDPAAAIPPLLSGPRRAIGARVVGAFLQIWETPTARESLLGLVRAAMTNDAAAGALRDVLAAQLVRPVVRALRVPDADLRATLVGSHLLGLGIARYVIRVEPLASVPSDRLVAAVAPAIQRYVAGPL